MIIPWVFYFSLNSESVDSFYDYNDKNRACELLSFRLFSREKTKGFKHASNLVAFLGEKERGFSLPRYVIVDYLSLCSPKTNYKEDSIFCSRELILRTILNYPDIYFLFDETRSSYEEDFCFLDFLYPQKSDDSKNIILKDYHTFKATEDIFKTYEVITRGRDNLFDGTNLRYTSRQYIHNVLKVNRYNFSLFQNSRRDSLALCVEEEYSQNRTNSYALYANGFRVLPIVTASELKNINNCKSIVPDLIIRDFDLQFSDAVGDSVSYINNNKETDDNNVKKYKINEVDYIRGAKFCDKDEDNNPPPSDYEGKWYVPEVNQYWNNLKRIPTFFISKGVKGIEFFKTNSGLKNILNNEIESTEIFKDKVKKQYVRGLIKPVSGIYYSFQFFEKIRERYKSFEILNKPSSIMLEASSINVELLEKPNKGREGKPETDKEPAMKFFMEKYKIKPYHSLYRHLWFLFRRRGLKILDEKLKKIDCEGIVNGNKTIMELKRIIKDYLKKRFHLCCIFEKRNFSMPGGESEQSDSGGNHGDNNSSIVKELKSYIKDFLKMKFPRAYRRISSFIKKTYFIVAANKMIVINESYWEEDKKIKNQEWFIDTSRKNHDHGVPLNVYDLVQSMLFRAKIFYNNGRYIKAAVISSETIELLNGFHESLMLRAYYYLAISENAIAMNTTGGSEFELVEDTKIRINKIQKEIDRILDRPIVEGESFTERRELKYDILNQIFSECRKYCREKEYFGPENCFISALAHVNEGYSPNDIWYEIRTIWYRIKTNRKQ